MSAIAEQLEDYGDFLARKTQLKNDYGFTPLWMPDFLFDFQAALVDWSLRTGRSAIFADCGLGKTAMQLVWAENVIRKTNKPVLIVTPLAVSTQTVEEAEKFGIEAKRCQDGTITKGVVVTNYERLKYFNWQDFGGMVCDESSILKNFQGAFKSDITEFMRKLPYRLLCTATAAPNDFIELGTSSEALGHLGHLDMLSYFFFNDQNSSIKATWAKLFEKGEDRYGHGKWRFKGHAEQPFWRWVTSWSRSIRKPSDLGFADDNFILPPLEENEHLIKDEEPLDGYLFSMPAVGLFEQKQERRRTVGDRCEKVAELVNSTGQPALIWCHMNEEGDLLESLIPDAVQVAGKDSDTAKEERLTAFQHNEARVLITKPKIGAWGLNFQHCNHVVTFPSHSFEQHYQGIRRCWRFGQNRPVTVDIVTTEGEIGVMKNLQRKQAAAERMFSNLVEYMNESIKIEIDHSHNLPIKAPSWL